MFNCVVLCLIVLYYVLFMLVVLFCIVCMSMCTVLLPPGDNPIAVNKYITKYKK